MIYIFESILPSTSVETVTTQVIRTYVPQTSLSYLKKVFTDPWLLSQSLEDILEWLQESGFSESVIEKFEGANAIL